MEIERELLEEAVSVLTNTEIRQEERVGMAIKLNMILQTEDSALKKISSNLLINYIEVNNSHYEDGETEEDEDIEHVTMLELSLSFHGKHCTAYLNPESLNNENHGSYATIETSTSDNLLDSLDDCISDDYWPEIRKECIKFIKQEGLSSDCDECNK